MNRRGLLLGLTGLLAAPALARPGILMPVRPLRLPDTGHVLLKLWGDGIHDDTEAFRQRLLLAGQTGKPFIIPSGATYWVPGFIGPIPEA